MRLKYKLGLAIVAVAIAICLMAMQSYALWIADFAQEGENLVSVGCFDVEMEEINKPISLKNTYPVSDSKGLTQTPYTIKLSNTKCTTDAKYVITLNTLTTNTMDNSKIKFAISTGTPTSGTNLGDYAKVSSNINVETGNLPVENLDQSIIIQTGTLKQGASVTYNIYLWIDESAGNEVQGQKFEASINVVSSAVTLEPTVADKIIEQLDTTGACPTVNDDGTVQVTGEEENNGYLCSASDDYGTSYYYRGNVENNWVKFAGFYWRILRINGDGSIRMIYAGDASVIDALPNKSDVLKNGYNDSNTDYTQIGTSAYNSSYNDNAYVGYMYGTTGSSTYEDTHANTNDSTIKSYLDNWYKTNIEDKGLSSYVSDTLFCNDRSFNETNTGTGTGTSYTRYRWSDGPWDSTETQYPRLTCPNQNDRFTVDDEITGNGDLSYPIGLVTTDEVVLAGGYSTSNSGYYLYTGNTYWTMSPYGFNGADASVRRVYSSGNSLSNLAYFLNGVRPILNLIPDSLKVGSGTADDPWRIAD